MHEIDRIIDACREIIDAGRGGLLVTLVATRGSTYRRPGARVVIDTAGTVTGALSGGCVERDLYEKSGRWMKSMQPLLVAYDSGTAEDIVFGHGLGCRGAFDMYVEPFDAANPPRLVREFRWEGRTPHRWTTELDGRVLLEETIRPQRAMIIFGGGADAPPVAAVATAGGWQAEIVAPRDVHPEEVAATIDLSRFDVAVIMTHNYLYDLALLEATLHSGIAYVGLLGPRARGQELLQQLTGISEPMRARLHNPIGLDLGGDTPEEIALAIVAEAQAAVNGRPASSLRRRAGPIHEDERLMAET